ncbi:hypothetical protein GCM10009738_15040 [Kitasatospora viridis]|uniref:DUF7683 domain-containing protein n=1 Tax=Kitasatospora viridis TaxID=281105 RepID=A0A561TV25_9ACTN|nr:hypothetical protein FHX73_1278 [Kitasatospora viridis]
MIWVVLGFDRSDDTLAVEWELPADFTEADAARLVGPFPDLIGSSFPLSDAQLAEVERLLSVEADSTGYSYFLEAQDDS